MVTKWRILWYAVLLWILAFLVNALVIFPWYYLILPILVYITTVFYFRKIVLRGSRKRGFLFYGLYVAVFWCLTFGFLDFLEIVGPYYLNLPLYFSDIGNWLKYALVLLVPVIYGLILENAQVKRALRRRYKQVYEGFVSSSI